MLEINCVLSINELKWIEIEMNWGGTSHCQMYTVLGYDIEFHKIHKINEENWKKFSVRNKSPIRKGYFFPIASRVNTSGSTVWQTFTPKTF